MPLLKDIKSLSALFKYLLIPKFSKLLFTYSYAILLKCYRYFYPSTKLIYKSGNVIQFIVRIYSAGWQWTTWEMDSDAIIWIAFQAMLKPI